MRIMLKFQQLIRENIAALAELITREHGKTLPDAEGKSCAAWKWWSTPARSPRCSWARWPRTRPGVDVYNIYQPLGVGAGITAFNFPVMLPCFMFPIAIACGNAFVLKPSSRTRLLAVPGRADVPGRPAAGVLNVVHGGPTSNMLCDHPDIKAVSFIGSTHVGTHIYRRASEAGKRAQSMMGAKNHCVVLADANKDQAINNLLGAAFGAAGQRCMANSVVVLVGEAREWLPEIVERSKP
jgi:malonate-semialdehyde dehydrogenase (acetylating)/methylmalonate-semialdehyde dehydrogenase